MLTLLVSSNGEARKGLGGGFLLVLVLLLLLLEAPSAMFASLIPRQVEVLCVDLFCGILVEREKNHS